MKINQRRNFLRKLDLNKRKNRHRLYAETFLKHDLHSQVFTLQKEAINLSLHSGAFALNPCDENLQRFAQALGDLDTTVEFCKLTIDNLSEIAHKSKVSKLERLYDYTIKRKKMDDKIDSEPQSEIGRYKKEVVKKSKRTLFDKILFRNK